MALTKNGLRTGKAGATEKREFLESLQPKEDWTNEDELELLIKMRADQIRIAKSYNQPENKTIRDGHIRVACGIHKELKALRKKMNEDSQ